MTNKNKLSPKERELQVLFNNARIAGLQAVQTCTPTPMIVTQHANPLDDSSAVQKQWFVPSGVCGFAWVVIYPGNSPAANFAKKHLGGRKHYRGGVSIWVSEFGQSIELKEAYATAYANVLHNSGINAYSDSRLD